MATFKFGDTVYNKPTMSDWNDKLSPIYDDSNQFTAISRTFTHEEDDFTFDYVYVVNAYLYEDHCVGCELLFVVMTGYEDAFDALQDGYIVPFETESIYYGDGDCHTCLIDHPAILEWVTNAANAFEVCDRLRGFYLDRHLNMIGYTGWDFVNFSLGRDSMDDWLDRVLD